LARVVADSPSSTVGREGTLVRSPSPVSTTIAPAGNGRRERGGAVGDEPGNVRIQQQQPDGEPRPRAALDRAHCAAIVLPAAQGGCGRQNSSTASADRAPCRRPTDLRGGPDQAKHVRYHPDRPGLAVTRDSSRDSARDSRRDWSRDSRVLSWRPVGTSPAAATTDPRGSPQGP
jgi:hypothetical protein